MRVGLATGTNRTELSSTAVEARKPPTSTSTSFPTDRNDVVQLSEAAVAALVDSEQRVIPEIRSDKPRVQKIINNILRNDPSVTELNLSMQILNDADITLICEALEHNSRITSLDVSKNYIGPDGARALAGNNRITRLDVSNTRVRC